MPQLSIDDIDVGSVITFRSKNPNDVTVWQGTLESRGSYRSIRGYTNPAAYNEAVRQTDPQVPSDVTTLHYFVITIDNDATQPIMTVFAKEWIAAGSLNKISLGNKVTLEIDDPAVNTQAILSILANAGYASKIIS